ncbi:hypothetical protein PAPHI01_2315 [Pancytospora philotis]|nr:hypothetical protein PAPHI01_2315 [Pancytospora philotis]
MSEYGYALLIEKHRADIMAFIAKHKTVIIKGPTGCGKTTYVPLLYRDSRIAIVEPRRIAVTSLYNTLAPHMPGLGYKMRFSKKCSAATRACIYTDGSFLNEIADADFDYIIIDEVHERSVRTDVILSILRTSFKGKLILMSASIDSTRLEQYFGAKTYEIPGHSHPLEVRYLPKPTSDYIVEAYMAIRKVLSSRDADEKKDILVFLPGEEDISELAAMCKKIPGIATYKMHSAIGDQEQMRIYEASQLTRVILSTNICETSLTIPNIKYVIDSGLCKTKIYDGIGHLGIQSTSRDSAVQRAGRCNRLWPGVCYRLYTEFELLPSYVPEICRTDLSTVFLQLVAQRKNILGFSFIDHPPVANAKAALQFLLAKGCIECAYNGQKITDFATVRQAEEVELAPGGAFIDYSKVIKKLSFRITPYGTRLVRHPFDVHLSNFYEACIASRLGYYGSQLLALISQENYNFLGPEPKTQPDILHLVDLLEKYSESADKQRFCAKNGVPPRGMELACSIFKHLNKSKEGAFADFERVFSAAFSHNVCVREQDGSYRMLRNSAQVFIHPSSAFFKRRDRKIVVLDIFCTTKSYARIAGRYFD